MNKVSRFILSVLLITAFASQINASFLTVHMNDAGSSIYTGTECIICQEKGLSAGGNLDIWQLRVSAEINRAQAKVISSAPLIPGTGSISGYKINDTNGNGVLDANEQSLSGWIIRLTGITGTGKDIKVIRQEITTDARGFYRFSDLPAGNYILAEVIQSGWIPVSSPVRNIELALGENSTNNNFTNRFIHVPPVPIIILTPPPTATSPPPLPTPPLTSIPTPIPTGTPLSEPTVTPTVTPTPSGTPPVVHGAPEITVYSPPTPLGSTAPATETFRISVNQIVDVAWYFDGTVQKVDNFVTEADFTTTAGAGTHNVTAVAENENGTSRQVWIWDVSPPQPSPPEITGYAPPSPVKDTSAPATRTFNITVNQTVNVTWYFDGAIKGMDNLTTEANFTETAEAGRHEVHAVAENENGIAKQVWNWDVIPT